MDKPDRDAKAFIMVCRGIESRRGLGRPAGDDYGDDELRKGRKVDDGTPSSQREGGFRRSDDADGRGTGEVIGSYKVAVRRDYTVGIIVEGRWGNNVGQIVMAMMIVNGIGRFQRAMAWARMKPWIE